MATLIRTPKYYAKGTMVDNCRCRLNLFRNTWPRVREWVTNGKNKAEFPSANLDEDAKKAEESPDSWTTFKTNMYTIATPLLLDRINMLYKIERALPDGRTLLNCTDDDVAATLETMCKDNKKASIQKKVSTARSAFFAIGRNHAWGDGSECKNGEYTPTWAFTGCPVSAALQDIIIAKCAAPPDEEHQYLGGVVEFPLMAWYNVEQLVYCLELLERDPNKSAQAIKQFKNSTSLGMMILLLMHTGARPGNACRLTHEHLYFNGMHTKVYWLTLAFLRPATLAYLITQDAILHSIAKIHDGYKKGKAGSLRIWAKTNIPESYNSLDLPLMFALYWKMILQIDFNYLKDKKVFQNTPQSYSSGFKARNEAHGLKNLVLYSMRYSASVADEKNNIPMGVRRKRMAHSEKSDLSKTLYAKCNTTVKHKGEEAEEEHEEDAEDDGPVLMNPLDQEDDNLVFTPNWFKFADEAMRQDFEECAALVTSYVESETIDLTALKQRLTSSFKDTSALIPLGTSYILPVEKKLQEKHELNVQVLKEWFAPAKEAEHIPRLSDFTALLYGDWRNWSARPAAPHRPAGHTEMWQPVEDPSDPDNSEDPSDREEETPHKDKPFKRGMGPLAPEETPHKNKPFKRGMGPLAPRKVRNEDSDFESRMASMWASMGEAKVTEAKRVKTSVPDPVPTDTPVLDPVMKDTPVPDPDPVTVMKDTPVPERRSTRTKIPSKRLAP